MHKLQNHILKKLITSSACRYSDLKPKLTEGNLFMYHLKLLIQDGLVKKRKDGQYELTSKGKDYVDKLSLETFAPRIQPKIVTLVVCKNNQGDYLFYLRKREPFFNQIGFPYGKIHLGETAKLAAQRELLEKTGLVADLRMCGDVYLMVYQGEDCMTQMLCHVFCSDIPKGELKLNSKLGKCFWGKFESQKNEDLMPGVKDIFKLVQKNSEKLFFAEFEYKI